MIVIWVIVGVLLTRCIELFLFMRKVSKLCNEYDWKYINKNPMCLLDKMNDEKGYFLTSDWSAYNFLYMKGPSPKKMFLSFKPLTLKTIYDKKVLDRLKQNET
jgi:hypothetical protein